MNPTTRRTFSGPGTCTGGACSYPFTDTTCASGCAAGACVACTPGPWMLGTIDSANPVSDRTSPAVDGAGGVHVSYHDAAGLDLEYACKPSGGAWSTTTVDSVGRVGEFSSLAVDAVDSAGRVGEFTSLALDGVVGVHVSYYAYANSSNTAIYDLKYAYKPSGGVWTTTTVDAAGRVGTYTSLAVDGADGVHISYFAYASSSNTVIDDLKYAYKPKGGAWIATTVDSAGSVGEHTSLAVDSAGSVHISYFAYASGGEVRSVCHRAAILGRADSRMKLSRWSVHGPAKTGPADATSARCPGGLEGDEHAGPHDHGLWIAVTVTMRPLQHLVFLALAVLASSALAPGCAMRGGRARHVAYAIDAAAVIVGVVVVADIAAHPHDGGDAAEGCAEVPGGCPAFVLVPEFIEVLGDLIGIVAGSALITAGTVGGIANFVINVDPGAPQVPKPDEGGDDVSRMAVAAANALAAGDPGIPAADAAPQVAELPLSTDPLVQRLTQQARNAARDGNCHVVARLGREVARRDPDYFVTVFQREPAIAACR